MFDRSFVLAAIVASLLAISACSIYFSPHGKRGGVVITVPPEEPSVKPMPDK